MERPQVAIANFLAPKLGNVGRECPSPTLYDRKPGVLDNHLDGSDDRGHTGRMDGVLAPMRVKRAMRLLCIAIATLSAGLILKHFIRDTGFQPVRCALENQAGRISRPPRTLKRPMSGMPNDSGRPATMKTTSGGPTIAVSIIQRMRTCSPVRSWRRRAQKYRPIAVMAPIANATTTATERSASASAWYAP